MDVLQRCCQSCGQRINGRSDKKFCHDYCRSAFHNTRKEKCTARERQINKVLHSNRTILSGVLERGQAAGCIKKLELLQRGFNFRYHTHGLTSDQGVHYFFCYELGYAEAGHGEIWVTREVFGKV